MISIRRERLEAVGIWNGHDLERKLAKCKNYYDADLVHQGSASTGLLSYNKLAKIAGMRSRLRFKLACKRSRSTWVR